mmetsp:Transcript_19725/g.24882  ORF Transcript_19725/g.24882 Transcript_19725/m.24882 type:complete len:419 (+) Transcript_19725:158-1414(+)|eukprot:CAMPEP_0203651720 /NCGR_PEP_ID=MMETSP0088-20131115/28231_1 /ASSEMBLY_ACC=CAM_ASM_001087 /TAXON_ID=426623 /ORGANISM="Chaetoceros affinis, Strain CCMP159" /LENGTH=418 /DNA_ID=CAMNT_0050510977 /DNA_START=51 /DNA_END=1307 /DNA_ORIENTATION=+
MSRFAILGVTTHDKQERRNQERKILAVAIGACLLLLSLVRNLEVNLTGYTSQSRARGGDADEEQEQVSTIERSLSINLGHGNCEWTKPEDAPQDAELFSTLLAAFPGSGKRTAFMQLEGLTELRAGDDYNLSPDSVGRKFAFMKSNYPQHEGIWSFGNKMNQVILLVRNPRWALPSYQHLLHEIEYSVNWETSYARRNHVYTMRPPIEDWIVWREIRFEAEIKKWGWFIDYWMEGGLCRDIFTNDLTTPEHFERLTQPIMYAQAELLAAQEFLGSVPPTIDEHCKNDMENCKPVAIASFEKIVDPETGPQEVDRFVSAIEGKVGLNVIEEEARECVWRELIINGKGNTNTYRDRDGNGPDETQYRFTLEQMHTIQDEIARLRSKYSQGHWLDDGIAQSLVEYLDSYTAENDEEIRNMT